MTRVLARIALAVAVAACGAAGAAGDAQRGRALYLRGATAGGEPLAATVRGDVPVSGATFACARCHRRSGMGSSEGGVYVPPITARHLFAARSMDRALRNERFKELFMEAQPHGFWSDVRMPRARPAYDAELLRRAVTDGVDAAGRAMDANMPRYRLSREDADDLLAYLATLSAGADPGVDDTHVQLATVVAAGADPRRKAAFLATARAFVDWINRDTANDLARGDFSPWFRTDFKDAWRRWRLHVWELDGPQQTWPAQLRARYREQPVFAVVSGLVPGPWAPVARFCDAERVPCLFPNTPLPQTAHDPQGYTLYFSGGLEIEARALARWLAARGGNPRRSVVQVHVTGPLGAVPARSFAAALAEVAPDVALDSVAVAPGDLHAALRAAAGAHATDTLVVWPGAEGARAVAALNDGVSAARVVLSSTALDAVRDDLAPALAGRVRVVSPYESDLAAHPRRFRVRAWMRSRRVAIVDWFMQAQTFYAFTVLQYGLEHLLTDFHRDYLLEIIEHEAENDLNPGIYPALALGPGQRFASKGAHVMQLHADRRRGFVPDGAWIVPE